MALPQKITKDKETRTKAHHKRSITKSSEKEQGGTRNEISLNLEEVEQVHSTTNVASTSVSVNRTDPYQEQHDPENQENNPSFSDEEESHFNRILGENLTPTASNEDQDLMGLKRKYNLLVDQNEFLRSEIESSNKRNRKTETLKEEEQKHHRCLQVLNRCPLLNNKFDGNDNIESWLRNYEHFASLNNKVMEVLTMKEKVTFIKTLLTEKVQTLIDRDQTLTTVEKLVAKLRVTYANQVDWNRKLHSISQLSCETVTAFLERIRMTLNKSDDLNAPMNKTQLDNRTLQLFWYRARPEIEESLTLLNPKSVEEALHHALVIEEKLNKENRSIDKKPKNDILNNVAEAVEPYKNDIHNRFKQMNEKFMEIKATTEKTIKNDLVPLKEELNQIKELVAQANLHARRPSTFRNNNDNHFNRYNSNRQRDYRNNVRFTPYHVKAPDRRTCYICNKPGHTYMYCRSATDQQKTDINTRLNSYRALPRSEEGTHAH